MNYITKLIENKIANSFSDVEKRELKRAGVDFLIILILSYLWSEGIQSQDLEGKKILLEYITRPSLGDIFDCYPHFLNSIPRYKERKYKKLKQEIEEIKQKYTKFRNSKIGHGYSFEDNKLEFNNTLEDVKNNLLSIYSDIVGDESDFIYIHQFDGEKYEGYNFIFNTFEKHKIQFLKKDIPIDLNVRCLYIKCNDIYNKITPFINFVVDEDNFFIYSKIQDTLKGSINTIGILKTKPDYIIYDKQFCEPISYNDGIRKISSKNTIINNFQTNFEEYIEVGVLKDEVNKFLTQNSTVCATVWGHGGAGKTALVQSICTKLWRESECFSHIIFLSAKDRKFNYKTSHIEEQKQMVSSYQEVIKNVALILFGESEYTEAIIQKIKSFQEGSKKILIVIDDFETFSEDDQNNIKNLIENTLDVNKHKVIITTRMDIKIGGMQIKTNELNTKQIEDFLNQLIKSKTFSFSEESIKTITKQLSSIDNLNKIKEITWGRPLFLYQLTSYLQTRPNLESAWSLERKFSNEKEKIKFLYERIYESLSDSAKDIFVIIGKLLQDKKDLSEDLERIKYLGRINQENFEQGVEQLISMRLIEKFLNESAFRVYGNSKEIQEMMLEEFNKKNEFFTKNISERLIFSTKGEKLGESLIKELEFKISSFEKEESIKTLFYDVINGYFDIDIKFKGLFFYTEYLAQQDKMEAINLIKSYENILINDNLAYLDYLIFSLTLVAKLDYSDREKVLFEYSTKIDSFLEKNKISSENKKVLELKTNLLVQESTFWINRRNLTKNEIDSIEKKTRKKEEAEHFKICFEKGWVLFEEIKKLGKTEITEFYSIINNTLYTLIEICRRTQKITEAREIYTYTKDNFDGLDERFTRIINKMESDVENYSPESIIANIEDKIIDLSYEEAINFYEDNLKKEANSGDTHNKILQSKLRYIIKNKNTKDIQEVIDEILKISLDNIYWLEDTIKTLIKYRYFSIVDSLLSKAMSLKIYKELSDWYIKDRYDFLKNDSDIARKHNGYNELSIFVQKYITIFGLEKNSKYFFFNVLNIISKSKPKNNLLGIDVLKEFKNQYKNDKEINFEIYDNWFS